MFLEIDILKLINLKKTIFCWILIGLDWLAIYFEKWIELPIINLQRMQKWD